MAKLYSLEKHLRTAAPVIERLFLLRQRVYRGGTKALLEEPVRGMGREREELAQTQALGAFLAGFQQPLAVARVAIAARHREAGELRALVVGKGIERRAAYDARVVLDHQEVADLGLEQLAAALHQRAFGLERLDQREHAAHVLDARRAQLLDRVRGDHGADPGIDRKSTRLNSSH